MAGTLFVVATPIGNLEDLTFRALKTLKEVDLIAAEDTRRTSKLLARYDVHKPLFSLREHNEARETPRLVARLAAGASIALVTDAGTPGIADPGARIVDAAHRAGIRVVPIPGPSAVTAALSASGFASEEFVFMGFPPASGSAREEWLQRLSAELRVVVFFEAPHRINRTIGDITKMGGQREAVLIREMTKFHETLVKTPTATLSVSGGERRGEFVVVLGPVISPSEPQVDVDEAHRLMEQLSEFTSIDHTTALTMVSAAIGIDAGLLRKALKRHRISMNNRYTPSS